MAAITSSTTPNLQAFGAQGGHLVLHMDVNGTIIAFDPAGGQPEPSQLVNDILAKRKRYAKDWENNGSEPKLFKDYVFSQIPGDRWKDEISTARNALIHRFVEEYKGEIPGLKDDHDEMMENLDGVIVFKSFFKLLKTCEKMNVVVHVALRTFGRDMDKVIDEIHTQYPTAEFVRASINNEGKLVVDDKVIEEFQKVEEFYRSHKFIAVQDNFKRWSEIGRQAGRFGKPFPVPSIGSKTHSVFIDDNVDPKPERENKDKRNIVAPITAEGPGDTIRLTEDGLLVQAKTYKAINDKNYFLNKVEASLEGRV